MRSLRVLFLSFLFMLATCGDTNLGGGVTLPSNGGGNLFTPGTDLQFIETSQSDFSSGTLNQMSATASGDLELGRNYIGETGRLVINDEISMVAATTVNFRNTYTNPVVVAYIVTRANAEPMDVRVTNVTTTGFDIFIDDPEDDGIASAETVVYMVVESGRHDFVGGLSIEAGVHNTVTNHISPAAFGGDTINFSTAFGSTPIILHTLNTYNNTDFKSSVCDSASTTQFTIAQETAQTGTATVAEDIAWVAIEPGNGTLIDINYDAGLFDDNANHGIDNGVTQVITYAGFTVAPDVLVKGSTGGGADGYWMRGGGVWNNTTHDAFSEEDTVGDAETSHANETFNSAAFTPDSDIGVYFASGTRETAVIDLSSVQLVASSQIQFTTNTPAGTAVQVETNVSLDGGSTW